MSRKLLLVASKLGYQTRIFAEAAHSLGLGVVMATDRCGGMDDPWGDQAFPLKFENPGASAERFSHHPDAASLAAVVAVGDRPALAAAYIAERLGLSFHPVEAVESARNKFLARERFRAAGLPVPEYFLAATRGDIHEAIARAPFPCVLKPLGLSGSRGVIRANTPDEFREAFARIRTLLEIPEILRQKDDTIHHVQIESYIPGQEFALEGLVRDGRLIPLALFDKPDPLEGPYFEETIYVTPSRQPAHVQAEIERAIQRAVWALGLKNGPVHAELRWNEAGPWVLEVAARPIGGLCSKALRFDSRSLEEIILRHALGETVSGLKADGPASGVMMIPIPRNGVYRGVAGLEQAARVTHIEEALITAKEGQELLRLPEGASYLGFLFARATKPQDVEAALREANSRLEFDIAATLPVMTRKAAQGG